MKSRKLLMSLLLIPVLLLSACSGASLALNVPGLSAQVATPVVEATAAPAVTQQTLLSAETQALADALAVLQDTFEQIYARVNPSVVNIQVDTQGNQSGLGSGFVWDREGHIVTNAHVVAGGGQISVTFSDGFTVDAELVGADQYSDLAVIKVDVDAARLQPVELADSNQVKVGQIAIAIGNPFGLQGTMTQGIISGLSRSLSVDTDISFSQQGGTYSIPDIIQTDASINPGNSGGVLVDDQGRVIGVTAAIASTTRANSGVGFVIPSAIVQKVVPSLIMTGDVQHSWMGISGTTLTPDLARAASLPEDQQGALVLSVTAGGPAAEAGVRAGTREASIDGQRLAIDGDVIIAIDGQTVTRFEDMVSYLYNQTEPGQTVTLTVLRQGSQQTIRLVLGALPNAS